MQFKVKKIYSKKLSNQTEQYYKVFKQFLLLQVFFVYVPSINHRFMNIIVKKGIEKN